MEIEAPPPSDERIAHKLEPPAEGSARIMVVGDTEPSHAARRTLEQAGHRVSAASDAAAALAVLERQPTHLVLTEGRSAELDGIDLCRSIRRRIELAGVPVIVFTSLEPGPSPTEVLAAGADDYLTKPFEQAELVTRVRLGLRSAQLRASEARLWAVIANVPGAIYRCANDPEMTMELISEEIERISGYPWTDFIGNSCRSFASLIHPDDRDAVARSIAAATQNEQPFELEYRIVRADGYERWAFERGQQVRGSDGRVWLDGAVFDITDRHRAQEALREREAERARLQEVRASRARIVEAADAARRRLERDLHDGAQQRLVALALRLGEVRSQLGDAQAAGLVDDALTELLLATEELRELARGLHPAVLTHRGLAPALEAVTGRAPLPVELQVAVEGRLPAPVEIALYFVVSEALTNVTKHAQAGQVGVTVSLREGRQVLLEVEDDGVGGVDPSAGSGLRGLADRVAALDGELEVDSPAGGGTIVRVNIPVSRPG